MATYLINHFDVPCSVPLAEGLEYSKQVEATFETYGADIAPAQTIPPPPVG
jgi:hypothetical protein